MSCIPHGSYSVCASYNLHHPVDTMPFADCSYVATVYTSHVTVISTGGIRCIYARKSYLVTFMLTDNAQTHVFKFTCPLCACSYMNHYYGYTHDMKFIAALFTCNIPYALKSCEQPKITWPFGTNSAGCSFGV